MPRKYDRNLLRAAIEFALSKDVSPSIFVSGSTEDHFVQLVDSLRKKGILFDYGTSTSALSAVRDEASVAREDVLFRPFEKIEPNLRYAAASAGDQLNVLHWKWKQEDGEVSLDIRLGEDSRQLILSVYAGLHAGRRISLTIALTGQCIHEFIPSESLVMSPPTTVHPELILTIELSLSKRGTSSTIIGKYESVQRQEMDLVVTPLAIALLE